MPTPCTTSTNCVVTQVPGPKGDAGESGATWIAGTGVPSAGTGNDGDFFFDLGTNNIYLKVSGAWVLQLSLVAHSIAVYEQTANPDAPAVGDIWINGTAVSVYTSGGWQSINGSNGTAANFPTNIRGDLMVDAGLNYPSADVSRLAVGPNGTRVMADSAQPLGMRYAKVDLTDATQVTGATPIANGGTGQITRQAALDALAPTTPLAGDILYYDGTHWTRIPRGTALQFLQTNSVATNIGWATLSILPGQVAWATTTPGVSGAVTIDLSLAMNWAVSVTDNITFTFANPVAGQAFTLALTVATGKTVTWPAGIKWKGGVPPTPTGTGGTDIWWFFYIGGTWYGAAALAFS